MPRFTQSRDGKERTTVAFQVRLTPEEYKTLTRGLEASGHKDVRSMVTNAMFWGVRHLIEDIEDGNSAYAEDEG